MRRAIRRPAAFATISAVTAATLVLVIPAAHARATAPVTNGRIAFNIDGPHGGEIDVIRRDGTGPQRLVHGDGDANSAAWSPDGRRIAFELDHPSGPTDCSVEIVNADGSGIVDLTGQRRGCEQSPSFTPDGRRIVFVAQRCGDCPEAIWSMDLRGGHRRKIKRTPQGTHAIDPNVSPDGGIVTFVAERRAGKRALYRVNMNGSNLEQIVPFGFDVGVVHGWSPDGGHIVLTVYSEYPDGHSPNVVTILPDGSGLVELTHETGDRGAGGASYSPDGRWIIFRLQDPSKDKFALWKMHPDGSEGTRITRLRLQPFGINWGPRPT
jgi:TolB protein